MTHSDTVVNSDGIELSCIATHSFNFLLDNLTDFMKMSMTRNKLIAMIGLPNCSCFIPAATQSARAPAILLPSVQTLLLNGCFISLLSLYIILFFIARRSLSSLLLTILTAKIVRIYETNNKIRKNFQFLRIFVRK